MPSESCALLHSLRVSNECPPRKPCSELEYSVRPLGPGPQPSRVCTGQTRGQQTSATFSLRSFPGCEEQLLSPEAGAQAACRQRWGDSRSLGAWPADGRGDRPEVGNPRVSALWPPAGHRYAPSETHQPPNMRQSPAWCLASRGASRFPAPEPRPRAAGWSRLQAQPENVSAQGKVNLASSLLCLLSTRSLSAR